jgi:hypothetical protein
VTISRRILWLAACVGVAGIPAVAWAQDIGDGGVDDGDIEHDPRCPDPTVGCHVAPADWHYRVALFDDVDFDTGFVPAGSPLQLRFGIAIGGSTEVDLGGDVVTAWPPALNVAVPGRPGSGRLAINYGFEIVAQLRYDLDIAGIRYTNTVDIPIPFIPEDLRLAGEVAFDPFVLPGADPRPVRIDDSTEPIRVVSLDVVDFIVDVPGVGGGFLVSAEAALETGYQTDRIQVGDALPIVGEGERTRVDPPVETDPDGEGGYGASAELLVHPEGTLTYDGRIVIVPELYVEALGLRWDFPLTEIEIPVVDLAREAIFDDVLVDVPLPDVDVQPARLDLGWAWVGAAAAMPLVFVNNGDAPLVVEAATVSGPFAPDQATLTIEPHRTARVSMRFRPEAPGEVAVMFSFATNDPDEPSLVVLLEGEGRARPEPDAGPEPDADVEPDGGVEPDAEAIIDDDARGRGCGCAAPGRLGQPAGAFVAALLLVGVVLRRLR